MPGRTDGARRLLIVDDSEDLRELLCEFLEMLGYDPVALGDGEAALQRLRDGLKPELVLLDRQIPRLDGPGLLEAAGDELLGVPVIWMTGAEEVAPHRLVVATLRKPFDLEALEKAVRTHLPG